MTKTFRDLGVDSALCTALEAKGITHPFPIQELTLPLALKGHDLIGQARTGTGKTLAFGLPLLQRVDPDAGHTQALVIVPTRELCLQVYEDLSIGSARGLTSISVYGGVGYEDQTEALQGGAHVVVGTPGRLLDLLNRRVLDLSKVTQLVLDEADEMLDMGFLPDVERLIEACQGEDRHTMLFSATMPTAIVKLARRYMDHPTFTRADHEQKETAPNVTQHFFQVHRMDKPRLLARILQDEHRGGVYVFVRTKHMADRLVNDLEELQVPAIAIHGDLRQQTREKNLDRFRSGKATVLVCTEVAARGLDVSGVTHVVNYDCPDDEKMYLHRIGRTARAGEAGVAITFAEFNEIDRLNVIRKRVEATDAEVLQVFSTSKVLRELFTLPDETPWDHLTKGGGGRREGTTSRSGGGQRRGGRSDARDDDRPRGGDQRGRKDASRSSGRREDSGSGRGRDDAGKDEARDDGRPRGRAAQTDGKPKSDRSSEGRGGKHDAERGRDERGRDQRDTSDRGKDERDTSDRGKDERSTSDRGTSDRGKGERSTSDRGTSDRGQGGRGRSERDTDDASTTARTRTRTRTRTRGEGDDPSDDARGGETSRRDDGGGRTRARGQRGRTDDSSDGGGSDGRGDDPEGRSGRGGSGRGGAGRGGSGRGGSGRGGSGRGGSGRGGSGDGGSDGGGQRQRGGQRRQDDQRSGGRQRQDDDRDRGDRDGDRDRQRSGGRSRANDRGGQRNRGGKGGGAPSGRGGQSGRAQRDDPTVSVARRGEEARGDGQPQLARRVKVEHLP